MSPKKRRPNNMSESSEEFEKKMLMDTLMKQSELMRNNAH